MISKAAGKADLERTAPIPRIRVRSVSDSVADGGCRLIALLGGEPLLEVGRIETIAENFPYTPVVVFTNGSAVTDKVCQELGNAWINTRSGGKDYVNAAVTRINKHMAGKFPGSADRQFLPDRTADPP